MSNMKTGTKILAGFIGAIVISLIIGVTGYRGMVDLDGELEAVVSTRLPIVQALLSIENGQMSAAYGIRGVINPRYFHEDGLRKAQFDMVDTEFKKLLKEIDAYQALPKREEEKAKWMEYTKAFEAWHTRLEEGLVAVSREKEKLFLAAVDQARMQGFEVEAARDAAEANAQVVAIDKKIYANAAEVRKLMDESTTLLDELLGITLKVTEDAKTRAQAASASAQKIMIGSLIAGTLLILFLGIYLANSIGRALGSVIKEVKRLRDTALDGKLTTRGDPSIVMPEFQPIVVGVNNILDAVVNPLNVSKGYFQRISMGDIPEKITEKQNGDFDEMKNALNRCIDAVNAMVTDTNLLAKAAVEGKLDVRADATKHEGDFGKVIQGVNDTLDTMLAPIKEASNVLELLSKYDLRARMKGNYQGDHAKIKDSLNQTAEALHNSISQVAEAVDQISSASGQIASSSQQVAEGASQQASSLEETSSSLEEMSSMTKQNAENTQQTKALTDTTKTVADRGASSMSNMVEAMGKIRNSAENTAEIIRDINEIAFQTNLLALNAAVEAARAGDAGRGFAVVAEEVRNLAGRSKEAAKKTEELIKQSVQLSENGAEISKAVNGDLNEIVISVGKVADIVSEITVASQEQSRGIDQVNKAVTEMDKVVQQSAANSEESSSAAEELAGQAQELAAMVSKFQLNRTATQRAAQATNHKVASKAKGRSKPGNGHIYGQNWSINPEAVIPMADDADLASF